MRLSALQLLAYAKLCKRSFFANCSGGIALSFALMAPVLLAIAGLAVDFANRGLVRSDLQIAADNAALAGARELSIAGVQDSQVKAVITATLSAGLNNRNGPVETSLDVKRETLSISVTVRQRRTPFLAHLISANVTPVEVSATALVGGTTNVCVLSLNPKDHNAIDLLKGAVLKGDGCTVYANSRDSEAIKLEDFASLKAELICSVGGAVGKKAMYEPQPITDCPSFADPLRDRTAPASSSCDFKNVKVSNQAATLGPGVYCGGITIAGASQVHFGPGVYVVKGKPFTVQDTASVDGHDVVFYLAGDKALINFTNNTTIRLSGREDGPFSGLLFFEDRSAPLARTHRINSAHAEELTGTIYLPRGKLLIDPNSEVAAASAYTAIIVWQLVLDYGPTLILHSDYGNTNVPFPNGIRVPGRIVLSR